LKNSFDVLVYMVWNFNLQLIHDMIGSSLQADVAR